MLNVDPGVSSGDLAAAQALADIATIAILQHRAASEARVLNEQLSEALNTRIVIEQAKGMVAERTGLDMEEAFVLLRGHARDRTSASRTWPEASWTAPPASPNPSSAEQSARVVIGPHDMATATTTAT